MEKEILCNIDLSNFPSSPIWLKVLLKWEWGRAQIKTQVWWSQNSLGALSVPLWGRLKR